MADRCAYIIYKNRLTKNYIWYFRQGDGIIIKQMGLNRNTSNYSVFLYELEYHKPSYASQSYNIYFERMVNEKNGYTIKVGNDNFCEEII
jgi:hypothetical protein